MARYFEFLSQFYGFHLTHPRKRKQAKMQWLQNPSQMNEGDVNNVRCEAGRTFTNKKGIFERHD
jgi:hypothetical protein